MSAELVLLTEKMDESPVTFEQIKKWTSRNTVLARVQLYVQGGWLNRVEDEDLRPYWNRHFDLAIYNGCLIWGNRVVVPPEGRETLLRDLHSGHPGISRMKSIARMFVWWPGIDGEIEKAMQKCGDCQLDRPTPQPAPLQPWTWPTRPWTRVYVDYAGPCFGNQMFLVLIDTRFSFKWIKVFPMTSTTSRATIQQLRVVFAQFGVPETVVTDNGSCFSRLSCAIYMDPQFAQSIYRLTRLQACHTTTSSFVAWVSESANGRTAVIAASFLGICPPSD